MSQRFQGLLWKFILIFVHMGVTTLCVPNELVLNGGFDSQVFVLAANETEMLIGKSNKKSCNSVLESHKWQRAGGELKIFPS